MADNLTTDDIIDVNDVGESEITGTEKIVALTAEGEVTTVSTSSVITANKSELETEKTTRANADTALEGKITTEVSRATTAENNLSTSISSVSTNLSSHTGNKSNPHGVTKSQVGLGNVPNVATNDQTPTYTVASENTALTSGEKLSVAFGKIAKAISSLISHLANKSNPHGVTKSQVGLGNVVNTGDSATPTSGGTTKFTTGGAYTLKQSIDKNTSAIATLNGTGTGSVTKAVSDGIAKVVANAPASFDTLKEISDWIDTHEDGASSMNSAIQANTNDITDIRTRVPKGSNNLECEDIHAKKLYPKNNIDSYIFFMEYSDGTSLNVQGNKGLLLDSYEDNVYLKTNTEENALNKVVAKSYKVCKNSASDPNIPSFLSNAELTDKHKKILRKIFGALCLGKCLSINLEVHYKKPNGTQINSLYRPFTIIGGQDWDFNDVTINKDGVTFDKFVDISINYSYLGGINDNGDFYSVDAYSLVTDIIKNDFSGVKSIKCFATIMENWI